MWTTLVFLFLEYAQNKSFQIFDIVSIRVPRNLITVAIDISPEHQDKVFERFYRVDKSHSKQSGGTGLGLSIVKHTVQYHHGKIAVESEPNKGTTISVLFDTRA